MAYSESEHTERYKNLKLAQRHEKSEFFSILTKWEKYTTFSKQVEMLWNFAEISLGLLRTFSNKNFRNRSLQSKDTPKCVFVWLFWHKASWSAKTTQTRSKNFETFQILPLDQKEHFPKRIFEKALFFQKIWQNALWKQEREFIFRIELKTQFKFDFHGVIYFLSFIWVRNTIPS